VGREGETPNALDVETDPGSGRWLVRVVPNKYPALVADAPG
jgi:hypothetical protein